jgi:lysophospholipase L1-like esterase
MKNFLAAAGLVIVATTLSVLAGEFLLLRVFLNPAEFLQARLVDDPILGYRIAPYTTGHDALGFRNAHVPERVDVVAVGDSQTYGVSATRENSWPQQLGRLLGQSVYNMALGGYGSGSDPRRIEPGIDRSRPARISLMFEPRPPD